MFTWRVESFHSSFPYKHFIEPAAPHGHAAPTVHRMPCYPTPFAFAFSFSTTRPCPDSIYLVRTQPTQNKREQVHLPGGNVQLLGRQMVPHHKKTRIHDAVPGTFRANDVDTLAALAGRTGTSARSSCTRTGPQE
jgi:hypothetical protein